MSEFYRAFEDRFRGSRDLILGRLEQYSELVCAVCKAEVDCTALDLGCGRGEWLELMQRLGIHASGCDLDEEMLRDARRLGLDVVADDAVSVLRGVSDQSLSIVSAFHLVEHLEHTDLRVVVDEAFRVIKPGGIIILETPNPESILVHGNFFTDPTHVKPLPPELLRFVVEFAGFAPASIWRMQENPRLRERVIGLWDVIHEVSPDYSIVGRKPAHPDATRDDIDDLVTAPRGIAVSEAASLFDACVDETIAELRQQVTDFRQQLNELHATVHVQATAISKLEEARDKRLHRRIKRFFKGRL